MIYLDYNATAPLRPSVVAAMQEVMGLPLNASSAHKQGRFAKKIVEDTRRRLAEFLNCWPQEVIWCGSASEANNAVLRCFPAQSVLVSAIEHSAIINASSDLEHIPVTPDGVVDLAWLEHRLAEPNKPALISVMFANNETGVLQPITEVVKLARAHGILVHCDAVQAVGKLPLDFTTLGLDYMTISFHKNGGPVGIAALIVRNGAPFQPFIRGGGQEFNRRAGTENVLAIAGVGALLESWSFDELIRVRGLVEAMEGEILKATTVSGGTFIVGRSSPRIGNTTCIIMPGISQEVQLMRMDLAGVCVSAGSACTSGKIELSHVLGAMNVSDSLASSALRISAGWNTQAGDCEAFVKAYLAMFTELSGHASIAL